MEGLLGKALIIVLAAVAGEGINEFFFFPWLDALKGKLNEIIRVQILRVWSGLVGVGVAWQFDLDIFRLLDNPAKNPLVGVVITGLLIGRGSNYVHELLKSFILGNEQRFASLDLIDCMK